MARYCCGRGRWTEGKEKLWLVGAEGCDAIATSWRQSSCEFCRMVADMMLEEHPTCRVSEASCSATARQPRIYMLTAVLS